MLKFVALAAKIAISLLLLYLSLRLVDFDLAIAKLRDIRWSWIALEIGLLVAITALSSLRWRIILRLCGADLGIATTFRYVLISLFFNQTLPSGVGGDGMKIWLAGRATNWKAAAYSVVLDRVAGVVSLAVLVIVCLPWAFAMVPVTSVRIALAAIGFGALAAAAVFVGVGELNWPLLRRFTVTRHFAAAARLAKQILLSPRTIGPLLGYSVLIQLLAAASMWCGAQAAGSAVPLLQFIVITPPILLISVVPISIAGWGIREGAMVAAFNLIGLPAHEGLLASLVFGLCYLALGVVGGATWVLTRDRRRSSDRTDDQRL